MINLNISTFFPSFLMWSDLIISHCFSQLFKLLCQFGHLFFLSWKFLAPFWFFIRSRIIFIIVILFSLRVFFWVFFFFNCGWSFVIVLDLIHGFVCFFYFFSILMLFFKKISTRSLLNGLKLNKFLWWWNLFSFCKCWTSNFLIWNILYFFFLFQHFFFWFFNDCWSPSLSFLWWFDNCILSLFNSWFLNLAL